MTPTSEFYYARKPTTDRPTTALVGPFPSPGEAAREILRCVKSSEDDPAFLSPLKPRQFRIFRLVEEVEAVVTRNVNVKLKSV